MAFLTAYPFPQRSFYIPGFSNYLISPQFFCFILTLSCHTLSWAHSLASQDSFQNLGEKLLKVRIPKCKRSIKPAAYIWKEGLLPAPVIARPLDFRGLGVPGWVNTVNTSQESSFVPLSLQKQGLADFWDILKEAFLLSPCKEHSKSFQQLCFPVPSLLRSFLPAESENFSNFSALCSNRKPS